MANTNYNEYDVIRILRRNSDINISEYNKTIIVKQNSNKIGNGTRGKIDYLINYCKYTLIYDNNIKHNNNYKINQDDNVKLRHNKRDKINLTAMVKNSMKHVK